MKKIVLVFFIYLMACSNLFCQTASRENISFQIDPNLRVDKRFETHNDSAFFYFDEGFGKDTITILINNIVKFKGILTSDAFRGFAFLKILPKAKPTLVTIKQNRRVYKAFEFNKNFSCLHLNYYKKILNATYTNRLYHYG
jgi:hypothetical protein